MPAFKFTANVPVEADIKYLDIVPGSYGEQIRLKGKIDGVESVAYLPGKRDEVLATLIHHGVIANKINGWPPVAEGQKGVDLPPLKRKVRLISEQPAGQKYGVLKVLNGSGAEAPSQSSAPGIPVSGTQQAAPAPVAEPTSPEKPRLDRLYLRATQVILDEVLPLYVKAGIGCSDTAVAAMAATLFIAASKESV